MKTIATIIMITLIFICYPMIYILTVYSTNREAYLWNIGITVILTIISIWLIKKEKEYIKELLKIIGTIILCFILGIYLNLGNEIEKCFWGSLIMIIIYTKIRMIGRR